VRRAGIGPWPQRITDLISTIFRLYGQNIVKLGLLSLVVAGIPAILVGAPVVLYLYLLGFDVTQGYFQNLLPGGGFLRNLVGNNLNGYPPAVPGSSPLPFRFLSITPDQWLLIAVGVVVGAILLLLLSAWQIGALAIAARDCTLGRPVSIGAALRGGLRRLLPVLGTMVLVGLIVVALFVLLEVVIVAMIGVMFGILAYTQARGGTPNAGVILLAVFGGVLLYFVFLALYVYVLVRLGMAPYIAAADTVSPGRAFGRSWSLVRGNWWRTFTPLLVLYFAVSFASGLLTTPGEFAPIFVLFLILTPLVTALVAPLWALAYVVIYYDLRLRREGYLPLAGDLGLPTDFPPPPGWPMGAPGPPVGPAQAG
jgi:hypothetical protein